MGSPPFSRNPASQKNSRRGFDTSSTKREPMTLFRHPTDGDTKPCPECRNTLVFSSHYPVLSVGMALARTGSDVGERIRYERAWVRRNDSCDYRELVGEG